MNEMIEPLPSVIGISGAFGAGKDAVADILSRRFDYARRAFADVLRGEAAECVNGTVDPECAPEDIRGVLARLRGSAGQSSAAIYQKPTSPDVRRLLQWWGTEYRRFQDPEYWIKAMDRLPRPYLLTVPDVRFRNELDWIRSVGGQSWKVERPGGFYQYEASAIKGHLSERDLEGAEFNAVLCNSGTLEDLEREVERCMGIAGDLQTSAKHCGFRELQTSAKC